MTKKEILNYLELITDELTDAHHHTDTDGTVDANYSVNTAQELVDELRDNLEGKFDHRPLTKEEATEAAERLMGPDGLPLSFPYHINDGEGRLKGNN